jgi:hypothetical protein
MYNVINYDQFLNEATLSPIITFLKNQYNNIFQNVNKNLDNIFVTFIKKVDIENNVSNLYQMYIKNSQTVVQNEINNSENIDSVNRILIDCVKYFYFSTNIIINKLQNDDFTIKEIFNNSRDKRLQELMSYPEDKFSNSVQQYINEYVLPELKKNINFDQNVQESNSLKDKVLYNVKKILEADSTISTENLVQYKRNVINWINLSLYDLLKNKMQVLNKLSSNISNIVDQLSKNMKGTNNENVKKMILNKIINMDKDGLKELSKFLGLTEEDINNL